MCLAETRSNGSILGLVRSKIGPVFSSIIRFGLVEASGPVKFKGLLIIVIVIVPSQLLEEASKHLCSLGVLLLQPFKDILNATLDHRVEGVSISSGDILLLDALGDNVAKEDLLVTLVRSLHVCSSLHDLSALVVIRGEVVLAASSDGGHDCWVLLLGSPLSSSSPSSPSSLPGQALPWDGILEALLTSCLLGGISFAGMFAVSSNESLHYLLLHALALACALAAPPPPPPTSRSRGCTWWPRSSDPAARWWWPHQGTSQHSPSPACRRSIQPRPPGSPCFRVPLPRSQFHRQPLPSASTGWRKSWPWPARSAW